MHDTAPIIVIVGPTAAGKTSAAIEWAQRYGAEIVSADSRQIYVGMDIGTGKASSEERRRVRHHLLDIVEPTEEITAADYAQRADIAIQQIRSRERPVFVVGGSMLYVRAILWGLFEGPPRDPGVRQRLQGEVERTSSEALWQRLRDVDPSAAERIMPSDPRRIIRALEVYELTGVPISEHHRRHQESLEPRYPHLMVGLAPQRELLYARIDDRVRGMFRAGLIGEVDLLRRAGVSRDLRSQQSIGYAEVHSLLDGEIDENRCCELIQRNSRRYARRQKSWYRGDPAVKWYEDSREVDLGELERYLELSR